MPSTHDADENSGFRGFLIIWTGQLLSRIGSGLSAFALAAHMYSLHGSSRDYSLLLLCAFLPSVLLSPFGGVFADRYDRKLLMILSDIGAAAGILFILLMRTAAPDLLWPQYLGVAFSALCTAVHSPAFKASVTDMLDQRRYAQSSGLIQLAEASRFLFAPIIAAFLLERSSLALVLSVDVATFLLGAAAAALVRETKDPSGVSEANRDLLSELSEGIRYLLQQKELMRLLLAATLLTFFTGVLQALFGPMILSFSDTRHLGIVQTVSASGMLFSSLIIGSSAAQKDQRIIFRRAALAAACWYLLIGMYEDLRAITLCTFGFFLTLPFINTSLEVLFRKDIDNRLQGRLWALISSISQLGLILGLAAAGIVADTLNGSSWVDGALFAGGGNGLAITGSSLLFLLLLSSGPKIARSSDRKNTIPVNYRDGE